MCCAGVRHGNPSKLSLQYCTPQIRLLRTPTDETAAPQSELAASNTYRRGGCSYLSETGNKRETYPAVSAAMVALRWPGDPSAEATPARLIFIGDVASDLLTCW